MANKRFNLPIDVGDSITRSTVLRNGLEIKAPVLDLDRVADVVDKLPPIDRFRIPRVLGQGIAAGTKVPRGTVVDLTLVPSRGIRIDLLEVSHRALRDRTVADVAQVIDDRAAEILARNATATALTGNDREMIGAVINQLDIDIDDTAPDASFEAAYQTLRDVQVFR